MLFLLLFLLLLLFVRDISLAVHGILNGKFLRAKHLIILRLYEILFFTNNKTLFGFQNNLKT